MGISLVSLLCLCWNAKSLNQVVSHLSFPTLNAFIEIKGKVLNLTHKALNTYSVI